MSDSAGAVSRLVRADQYLSGVQDDENHLVKYLTFNVAGGSFGSNIASIKEIIEHGRYTRIPLSQSVIRGVINLRGHVVPVIDLAKRLGYESQPVSKRSCIIIVEMDDEDEKIDLGFVVDAVDEVIDLDGRNIEPAPGFGLDIRQDFIEGMGKQRSGEFIKLLDLAAVLSVDELSGCKSSDADED